jgi:hypothetical protein
MAFITGSFVYRIVEALSKNSMGATEIPLQNEGMAQDASDGFDLFLYFSYILRMAKCPLVAV